MCFFLQAPAKPEFEDLKACIKAIKVFTQGASSSFLGFCLVFLGSGTRAVEAVVKSQNSLRSFESLRFLETGLTMTINSG